MTREAQRLPVSFWLCSQSSTWSFRQPTSSFSAFFSCMCKKGSCGVALHQIIFIKPLPWNNVLFPPYMFLIMFYWHACLVYGHTIQWALEEKADCMNIMSIRKIPCMHEIIILWIYCFVLSVDKNQSRVQRLTAHWGLKYFCCFLDLDDLDPKASCGLLRDDLSAAVFQQ